MYIKVAYFPFLKINGNTTVKRSDEVNRRFMGSEGKHNTKLSDPAKTNHSL